MFKYLLMLLFCLSPLQLFGQDMSMSKDGQYLLIFHAEWCKPCKQMQKNIWPHKTVQKVIKKQKFTVIFIDVDKKPTYTRESRVSSIPLAMVVIRKGKIFRELRRMTGYHNLTQTRKFLLDQGERDEEVIFTTPASVDKVSNRTYHIKKRCRQKSNCLETIFGF